MNAVCEVCGSIGYEHLLLCCCDCKGARTHQYCLDKVLYDASLEGWFCDECNQRHSEGSYSRSLGMMSSERPSSHVQFDSTSQQPISKKEVRFQLDNEASNELQERSMDANVAHPSTQENDALGGEEAELEAPYKSLRSELERFQNDVRPSIERMVRLLGLVEHHKATIIGKLLQCIIRVMRAKMLQEMSVQESELKICDADLDKEERQLELYLSQLRTSELVEEAKVQELRNFMEKTEFHVTDTAKTCLGYLLGLVRSACPDFDLSSIIGAFHRPDLDVEALMEKNMGISMKFVKKFNPQVTEEFVSTVPHQATAQLTGEGKQDTDEDMGRPVRQRRPNTLVTGPQWVVPHQAVAQVTGDGEQDRDEELGRPVRQRRPNPLVTGPQWVKK